MSILKRQVLFVLFAFAATLCAFAQNKTITGLVVDGNGESIIGASVLVKGTTNGIITDIDGKFTLNDVPEAGVIQISYIGYKTQEISAKNKANLKVVLVEDNEMLDEVVVVGYGVQKKSDVTGAMIRVGSEELNSRPVANAFEAMQGKAAGVDIVSNERPGEVGTINVRGVRSLSASNTPLYVVDGIPLMSNSGIETLNPQDIESIDVLKDASATAIYGSRGANGGGAGLQGTDRGLYDLNTFTTDEAMLPTRGGDWYDGGLWQNLFLHNWGTKNDLVKGSWDYLYKVIAQANQSLDKLKEILENNPENISVPKYISEVRAFRAMYYYYLLDMFARVPLVTSSSVAMEDVVQSERSAVFNFVRTELEESVEDLSDAHSNLTGEYYGRITKPVAYFLLAKLALNAEVYADDNWTDGTKLDGKNIKFTVDGTEMNAWEATIAYCDKIKNLGYKLEQKFEANFSLKNESSVENIFTIPMDANLYKNEFYNLIRSRHYNHGNAYGQGGWNGSSATKEALDAFGYGTSSPDPRFELTYYAGKVEGPNGTIKLDDGTDLEYVPSEITLDLSGKASEKTAGARMKKYELDASATNDGKLQSNDIVLFRYADVLLMKSEAKVRNGGNGDAELTEVRERAGATLDVTATLETLLEERLREFAWEGLRRQDLVRFGKFTRAYTDRPQLPKEDTGYTTVFPIHEDVLSLNGKLTQNYGY